MKPKSLVRLQIHQDFGHSLSVRPFAELSDRVRSDDRGGGQVPKEIPSLADAQAGDVAYRTPTQVAHTRQYAPPQAGGKSCLLSTFQVSSRTWSAIATPPSADRRRGS